MPKEYYGYPPQNWHVYVRDRLRCQYCGFSGLGDFDRWSQLSIDHLLPLADARRDQEEWLVVACKRCNELLGREAHVGGGDREARLRARRTWVRDRRATEYAAYVGMVTDLLDRER